MIDSQRLLREYTRNGSETAFRELVTNYLNLVYSSALRLLDGDSHLAEDVAQVVFSDLAQKAGSLSTSVRLGGWLHRRTCFVAAAMMRSQRRRETRERRAVEMSAMEDHSEGNLARLSQVLDEAINDLREQDRSAILLRFFEQRDFLSVGEGLGTNEHAAQKRVSRALEKLRNRLERRGVTLSAAALAVALAGQTATAAPSGLAIMVGNGALVTAAVGSGSFLAVLKLFTINNMKIGAVALFAVAAMTSLVLLQTRANDRLRVENELLRHQLEYHSGLVVENDRLSNLVAQAKSSEARPNAQLSEILRLRGEVGRLRQENKAAVARREENSRLALTPAPTNIGSGAPLQVRIFRIDPALLLQKIKTSGPVDSGETDNAALRRALGENGIVFNSPESIFYDDKQGNLIVRTTGTNMDAVELFLSSVMAGL